MQDTFYHKSSPSYSGNHPPAPGAANTGIEELTRIFNTAIVASHASEGRDFPGELFRLMESPAFRAILNAIRQHARLQGLTERQAADQVIQTFRKMDELWKNYVLQEGVDRIGNGS